MILKKNWFYNFCIALSVMGMAYILICGVSNIGENQKYPYVMKGLLLLVSFLAWMVIRFFALLSAKLNITEKLTKRRKLSIGLEVFYVILILAAAFILRYAVILNLPMQPESDYKTYYDIADMLKNGILQEKGEGYCNYIAMFPHIMGYSYILKNVFVFFGTSVFNGQFANILFSVGTVFLIYRIGRRLGGRLAGVIALTAAAFWPSQILYVNMLSAEYAFSFFLYLCILLFLHLVMDYDGTTKHAVRGIFLHILLGCLIAATAAIRPMALILLVAIIICIFPQKMKLPNIPRNSISLWVRFLDKGWLRGALILVSYMILSGVITTNIELAINKSLPSTSASFGYNLLVGLNTDSKGGWNEADSKLLYDSLDSSGSPIQAQITCRDQALVRLTSSDPKAIFNLLLNKYELLWGNDDYGVTWNQAFLKEQNKLTTERADFLNQVQDVNNIVYLVFIMFSLLTLVYLLQRKVSYLYVLILVYLGTAAMHLFVESQNRYHFHVLSVFMILASVGIGYIFENARESVKAAALNKQEKNSLLSREEDELQQFEEEEHQAIENRYKKMTNVFDMQSAIQNGNVIVTVSEKYKESSGTGEDQENVSNEEDRLTKEVYKALEEVAMTLDEDKEPEKKENSYWDERGIQDIAAQETRMGEDSCRAETGRKPYIKARPANYIPQKDRLVELTRLSDKIKQLEKNQKILLEDYVMLQEELKQAKIRRAELKKNEFLQKEPTLRKRVKGKETGKAAPQKKSYQKNSAYKSKEASNGKNLSRGSKPVQGKENRAILSLFDKKRTTSNRPPEKKKKKM